MTLMGDGKNKAQVMLDAKGVEIQSGKAKVSILESRLVRVECEKTVQIKNAASSIVLDGDTVSIDANTVHARQGVFEAANLIKVLK